VSLLLAIAGAIVSLLVVADVAVHWFSGWRYLLSPSFRRVTGQRWASRTRLKVIGEVTFTSVSFLMLNVLLGAVLWAVFVGPIPPVHQW
jgi:hypothetical protein